MMEKYRTPGTAVYGRGSNPAASTPKGADKRYMKNIPIKDAGLLNVSTLVSARCGSL